MKRFMRASAPEPTIHAAEASLTKLKGADRRTLQTMSQRPRSLAVLFPLALGSPGASLEAVTWFYAPTTVDGVQQACASNEQTFVPP
jgi:hypothetical protein